MTGEKQMEESCDALLRALRKREPFYFFKFYTEKLLSKTEVCDICFVAEYKYQIFFYNHHID